MEQGKTDENELLVFELNLLKSIYGPEKELEVCRRKNRELHSLFN